MSKKHVKILARFQNMIHLKWYHKTSYLSNITNANQTLLGLAMIGERNVFSCDVIEVETTNQRGRS
jgi:hypothetical protein